MDFVVDPRVEAYLQSLNRTADPVLEEMEELAREGDFPIVGAHAGKLLSILTRATGARRVLELGSGFGYSAWWFARSLPPGGRVTCTDFSADNRALALGFLAKAGFADKSEFLMGDELQAVRALAAQPLSGGFDIVFNDVDKSRAAGMPVAFAFFAVSSSANGGGVFFSYLGQNSRVLPLSSSSIFLPVAPPERGCARALRKAARAEASGRAEEPAR